MPDDAGSDLQVIATTYDLVLWTCRHLARFPRSFRFTLGDPLVRRLYDILDQLLRARYSRDRLPLLQAVNQELELLRFQFRLRQNTDSAIPAWYCSDKCRVYAHPSRGGV
jgi:hypothetical protein